MTEASADFNPFQAPLFAEAEKKTLGEDDEFLVSRRQILCRDTVQLPLVCIRYGETEHLERRHKILKTFTGLGGFAFILAVIAFFILLGALMNGDLPYSSSSFGMLAYGAIFILAVPATFWIFKRYGCCTVDATWYVGPRYRRRILWQQRIGRTIVFLVAMSAGGRMARESASMLPLIGMTLVGLVLCRFYDPNVRLQLAGRRRGFFVLKGHSKSFYHEVKRIGSGFQSVGEEVSTVTAE